jgi:hypothetical protein
MIGVIAKIDDHPVVREFFELFKTPWELYQSDRRYDVLICADDTGFSESFAKIAVIYGGRRLKWDLAENVEVASESNRGGSLSHNHDTIPIYGDCITFRGEESVHEQSSGQPVVYRRRSGGTVVARIGYDLFSEIHFLLTKGQPDTNAAIPTLELHIALLRDLIIGRGIPLLEIPPVPEGHRFIACLTHDVDHPSLRPHKFDHTAFGFLYRAVFGSLSDLTKGRTSLRNLAANWWAALKLPFVHLGLARDFWHGFDRYVEIEKGLGSTFFLIPFKRRPGSTESGSAPSMRASSYGASDIAERVNRLSAAGCEIGLHGIDAWLDSSRGAEELEEIQRLTGKQKIGIRMHWLYFREQSPATLEQAGVDYDSTVGYNGTVGYRPGTTQAFRPLDANHLLELPLHIMDTALFFPGHLHLSAEEARERVSVILENAVRFGGVVTINWHDRSIAPERLWGDFYVELLEELKSKSAWIVTAADAVSWFRKRRSATFENGNWQMPVHEDRNSTKTDEELPGLQLRSHGSDRSVRDTPINVAGSDLVRPVTGS